jgi:6-phosphogluconolactonase
MFTLNEYTDFTALTNAVTQKWLTVISNTPHSQSCSFALAGGTTPAPLYRQLDKLNVAREIQIVATDERWVPDADPQSNEGLFRRCFVQSPYQLLSLKNHQPDPASAVGEINQRLQTHCSHPFRAVILGMGTDGHIASLFPNAPQLLVKDEAVHCVAALQPQTQQARISLSFARLLNTNAIWLVITGAEKRTVLENASPHSPIGALLGAARCEVEVFWCP